ncbi:MAG: hypothetical protein ACI87E_001892 [Mariniblastus sp.]|jgi:hypothetical protein
MLFRCQAQRWFTVTCLIIAPCFALPATAKAQAPPTAANFLPETTVFFAHIDKPAELIGTLENHPVVKHVWEMKPVKQFMRSPQAAMAMLGRGLLEQQLGGDAITAFKKCMDQGVWLAFDTKTSGVIVLFRSSDEDHLKQTAGKTLKFISTMAKQDGNKAPFKKIEYRDAVAAEFDGAMIARRNNWFIITNQPKLAKSVVDKMIDAPLDSADSLSGANWFKEAVSQRQPADLWTAVDVGSVRKLVGDKEPFLGRTDNPGVELIFGGLLDLLKNTPVAMGELNLGDQIDVSINAPFDGKWANESREFFFGKELGGFAPQALAPNNMIASLTSYRDIGLWWLSKEDLYAENVIAQLANADSQLSNIFPGMDFGQDVLGALEPGVQIIVTQNQYGEKYIPDVKIPAFALVGKLKNPEKLQRRLKIAFQSVIGFANINLGMNGQPQLEVETETIEGAKFASAEYFYEDNTEEGLMLFNFAPTIAFQGSHLILSSKRELAVELAGLIAKREPADNKPTNTSLVLDGDMIHQILVANRESLIAQNMLEEGNTRDDAQAQMEIVFEVADLFKDANLDYSVGAKQMTLDVSVRFDELATEK